MIRFRWTWLALVLLAGSGVAHAQAAPAAPAPAAYPGEGVVQVLLDQPWAWLAAAGTVGNAAAAVYLATRTPGTVVGHELLPGVQDWQWRVVQGAAWVPVVASLGATAALLAWPAFPWAARVGPAAVIKMVVQRFQPAEPAAHGAP